MKRFEILNNAKKARDDEWYTLYSDVAKVFRAVLPYIKNYTILCPFDSIQSNFVKYLKQNSKNNNWIYYHTTDYESFSDYYARDDVVVISNPPFSKKREILKTFAKFKTKFILILPYLLEESTAPYIYTSCDLKIKKFMRPDKTQGQVGTQLMTNFIHFGHRVRFDKPCPHNAETIWKRGDFYWNCLYNHEVYTSRANWNPNWVGEIEWRTPQGAFTRGYITPELKTKLLAEFEFIKKHLEKQELKI